MTKPIAALAISAWMILAGTADPANATANHAYKKTEYPIIASGSAPSKLLSISSHGGGELGNDNFHLYLMAEPAHKIMARFEAIDSDNILDTAPDAFHAEWSADSRHVAVLFRADRHVLTMQLYEIRDRRPHLISGPDLLGKVIKSAAITADDYRLRSSVTALAWLSPTRFALKERDLLSADSPELGRKIGKFGKPNTPAEDAQAGAYFVDFSAQAVGELGPGNKYRILQLKPGPFDE
jgi:hypothetical protein